MQNMNNHPDELQVVPQFKVRLGLQGGASMESCEANVAEWQSSFNKWYNQSVQNGYKPPFPNPLA